MRISRPATSGALAFPAVFAAFLLLSGWTGNAAAQLPETMPSSYPMAGTALRWGAGPVLGLNLANADIDDHSSEMRTGLIVGARLQLEMQSRVSLVLEPKWVQKGADFSADTSVFDARGEFNFLEVPLFAKYRMPLRTGGVYGLGGVGINLRTAVDGQLEPSRIVTDEDIRLLEFTGELGIGGDYPVSDRIDVTVDGRYSHGFRNLLEDNVGDIDTWRSRDFRIMAGAVFHGSAR